MSILLAQVQEGKRQQFLQVIRESMLIKRHFQLFMWLQGDLQSLLPHDILLTAYGDFPTRKVRYDVASALPEVRTANLSHVDINDLTLGLYTRWINHGRTAFILDTSAGLVLHSNCDCVLHRTLRAMQSVMVHGMRDERAGIDSLYVMFQVNGRFDTPMLKMFEMMLPHVDFASRRVSGMTENDDRSDTSALEQTGVTGREMEILDWVRNGKTNHEIGLILNISPFTVKNHMQRIFKKIDVTNRAQAVARIEDLTRHA